MSTIITILIIAIIAALVIVGLKETIKHSKGEGASIMSEWRVS
mgnify:CR=1 FL=1